MPMRYKGGVISATTARVTPISATGVWTLSQQMQDQGSGLWPIGGPYFIGLLSGGVNGSYAITFDSIGNFYIVGYSTTASGTMETVKYNSLGVLQWQRNLNASGMGNTAVAVDSSSNVYVIGYSSGGSVVIVKYNTSGTLQWQRTLNTGTGNDFMGIAVDPSGNVYISAPSYSAGLTNSVIAKYNTSGTIQWQRNLSDTDLGCQVHGIAVDVSGNAYVTGRNSNTATGTELMLVKYNTSGTVQWQRALGDGTVVSGRGVTTDLSGNIYVAGESGNAIITKFNAIGETEWQKKLNASSNAYGVSVDYDGNVYSVGTASSAITIQKYNSSGTALWRRTLKDATTNSGYGIACDVSGNIYISGVRDTSGTRNTLFARLPGDGSLTGTYTVGGYSYTYASATATSTTTTFANTLTALSSATATWTDAAGTFTDTASSFTSSVTTL